MNMSIVHFSEPKRRGMLPQDHDLMTGSREPGIRHGKEEIYIMPTKTARSISQM